MRRSLQARRRAGMIESPTLPDHAGACSSARDRTGRRPALSTMGTWSCSSNIVISVDFWSASVKPASAGRSGNIVRKGLYVTATGAGLLDRQNALKGPITM